MTALPSTLLALPLAGAHLISSAANVLPFPALQPGSLSPKVPPEPRWGCKRLNIINPRVITKPSQHKLLPWWCCRGCICTVSSARSCGTSKSRTHTLCLSPPQRAWSLVTSKRLLVHLRAGPGHREAAGAQGTLSPQARAQSSRLPQYRGSQPQPPHPQLGLGL